MIALMFLPFKIELMKHYKIISLDFQHDQRMTPSQAKLNFWYVFCI